LVLASRLLGRFTRVFGFHDAGELLGRF
jgi:hypothetical protein